MRSFFVARKAGRRPLRSTVRFVVSAMPAGGERHPAVADHPDAQGLRGDPVALCGRLERIGAKDVADVLPHHVRALRDLNVKGQREKAKWVQVMAARKRKTLVVCRTCHLNAHDGSWNRASNSK